ncbi:response regulator receiver protein [Rippkaea orientalis PCC 8801]|uniref:Response regulator receiver protein n=1 Tax=Rippkaea orientalis (strain PCC 8801 / RF-1) TaxID=41431 RepID=B7JVE0_RIPO1|nr:response regulator [Rippkaea orientalis]ACK68273.1 response regulator receiver protein [Rippkaea orientalis PCC 8801]
MIIRNTTKMLLIEDDPNDIELIQLALGDYHFVNQLDIVEDGEQALQYLFGTEESSLLSPLPRLIWLDLKLPKISGIQVLEAIRSDPRTQNLVVVVMTSSAEDRDLEACYNLGVNSYIVKPFDFQQFIEIARQVGFYWMMLNEPPLSRYNSRD